MKKLSGVLITLFLFAFSTYSLPFTKLPKVVDDEKLEYSYGSIIDTGISDMNLVVFSPVNALKCIRLEPIFSKVYYDIVKETNFDTKYCISITDQTLMRELNMHKISGADGLGKSTLAVFWMKYSDYYTACLIYKRKVIEWLVYTNDKTMFQNLACRGAKTIRQ